MKKKELKKRLKALGELDEDTKKKIVCSLIGHSNILDGCMGYMHCARCGELLGDSLGGSYTNEKCVIVGHDCEICRKNYEKLTWKDKYLAPDKNIIFPKELTIK